MSVIVKGGGGKSSGLCVWAKYNADIGLGESTNNIALANDGTSIDIYVKENLYIKEDGTIGVQGEPYSTVLISSVVEDTCIGGMTPTKYCIGVDGKVYSSPLSHIAGSVDNCVANLVKVVKSTFIDFVVSDSKTAYPDGVRHTDGFYYEIFDKTGLYVWKKCSYVPSPTVTAQQIVADPSTLVLSSNDTDLTAYSFSDLIGLHLASDSSIKTYFEVIGDGTVKYYWNGSTYDFGRCTWDSSTKTLVVVGADYNGVNDNYTVSGLVGKKVLVDYVVSDSPTAYPDGGTQGGYWYDKVIELPSFGANKVAVDKFTFSSDLIELLRHLYIPSKNFHEKFYSIFSLYHSLVYQSQKNKYSRFSQPRHLLLHATQNTPS